MRRFLLVMIIPFLFASCWDTSMIPTPLNPLTEQRIFRSSIQSANNFGHGYFTLSVPSASLNQNEDTVTEDGEVIPAEPVEMTYAIMTIGRTASDSPEEFRIESGMDEVVIYNTSTDEPILRSSFNDDSRAVFRFDWEYSNELWNLRSGSTEIISDLALGDGTNVSIITSEYTRDDAVAGDDGVISPEPYPTGLRLDAVYNYFDNN